MNRKTVLLVLVALLAAAGCQPTSTAQPTPTIQPTPDGAGQALPAPVPAVPQALVSLPALETLSIENAARITTLAQVGEGAFDDHIRVSPDGNVLAVAAAGGVILFDAATGQRTAHFSTPSKVDGLAFSPDGERLAEVHRVPGPEIYQSGEMAGEHVYNPVLSVHDLTNGQTMFTRNLSGLGCREYAAWDLAFAPDGETLVFRDSYSLISHTRTENLCLLSAGGELIRSIPIEAPWQSVSPAWFTPDGRQLVVAVGDWTTEGLATPATRVRAYEANTGTLVREFDGLGIIHDMALSPDGAWIALAGQQGARLLSTQDGGLMAEVGSHRREVESVTFSPDGQALALGSLDGTVSLWAVPEGRFLWQSQAWIPDSPIYSEPVEAEIWDVIFSADGQVLFALAPTHFLYASGRVAALRAADGQEAFSLYGNNSYSKPGVSPDLSRMVFGGYEDGRAQVWSVVENRMLFELEGHTGMVLAGIFSPDGQQIATASADGTVRLWSTEDGSPVAALTDHRGPVRAIQYSPDGARLASVGEDAVVRIWDVQNGQLVKAIETQTGDRLANSITFSPDGKRLFLSYGCPYAGLCPAQGAGDLRQVDLESGQIETLIPYPVYSIRFSADQNAFAMESAQGIQTGRVVEGRYQPQFTYTSPLGTGALAGAGITPDGGLFLSGNAFGLHVWTAANGEMLALAKGTSIAYGDIWVTADQKLILFASMNGLVSVWGVPDHQ